MNFKIILYIFYKSGKKDCASLHEVHFLNYRIPKEFLIIQKEKEWMIPFLFYPGELSQPLQIRRFLAL